MNTDFRIIVITPETDYPDEKKWIEKLFDAGAKDIHLRKNKTKEELHSYLKDLPSPLAEKIVVHVNEPDNFHKIHLKESARKDVFPPDADIISTGFHSFKEAEENIFPYEYVFLSPVFNSISKMQYPAAFSEDELKKGIRHYHDIHPVSPSIIALGGISVENIKMVKDWGFDGVAVLGSVWKSGDPVNYYKKLLRQIVDGSF